MAAVGAFVKTARILLGMCTRREVEIYNGSFYVFINVQGVKTRTPLRNKSGWPASRSGCSINAKRPTNKHRREWMWWQEDRRAAVRCNQGAT